MLQTKPLALLAVLAAVAMTVPALAIASDSEGDPGLSVEKVSDVEFVFSAASPGTWSFDDGSRETGQTVTHAFAVSGLHYVVFSGPSGSGTVTALVTDRDPVALGAAGTPYRYCPGIVASVTTDCPGLAYDESSLCLLGTPMTPGTYSVTVTRTDGSASSFGLTVGDYPLGWFTAEVDHQSVTVSLYYQTVKRCTWTVYGSDGKAVGSGLGTSAAFHLPLGEYRIVSLASVGLGTHDSQELRVSVTEADDDDDGDGGDDGYARELDVLYYIAVAGLILFFAALIARVI